MGRTIDDLTALTAAGAASGDKVIVRDADGGSSSGAEKSMTLSELQTYIRGTILSAIAGLSAAADKIAYFTGATTAALADITSFGRTVIASANASALKTTLGITISDVTSLQSTLDAKQSLDATLTALAAYNTNGLLTQTAADTFAGRTITGTTNQITVTNGNGVSGNPTLSLPQNIHTGASPQFTGLNLSGLTASKMIATDGSKNLTSSDGPSWGVEEPSDLIATTVSDTEIDLDWSDNANFETNYVIERSLSEGSGYSVIATVAAGSTSYSDTGLTAETTYYYRLRGKFGPFYGSYTAVANATTDAPPGVGGPITSDDWTEGDPGLVSALRTIVWPDTYNSTTATLFLTGYANRVISSTDGSTISGGEDWPLGEATTFDNSGGNKTLVYKFDSTVLNTDPGHSNTDFA